MVKSLFKTPGPSPEGIAWDKEALWVVDGETKMIYRLSKEKGEIIRSLTIEVNEPKGLAWDGRSLWVSDNARKMISRLDIEGKVLSTIRAPIQPGEGPRSIEGLAWDGKYLWSACFAGWSSQFFRVKPEDGSVTTSIFCECNPRGLTSDGKYLWSICYNGEELPSIIDQRLISEEPLEMVKTRSFLDRIPAVKDPTGLAFDGTNLLISDKATRSIYGLEVKRVG